MLSISLNILIFEYYLALSYLEMNMSNEIYNTPYLHFYLLDFGQISFLKHFDDRKLGRGVTVEKMQNFLHDSGYE